MFRFNYKFFLAGVLAIFSISSVAFADLKDILNSGKVKIAVPESFAPFGSIGPEGTHVGYDVDVAKLVAENRGVKCKSKKDFKSIDMFEMCIWTDKDTKVDGFVEKTKSCQIPNANIYDESMFVGRIQINLNDGKKRRFLYFQSDYKIMQKGGKVFDPDS